MERDWWCPTEVTSQVWGETFTVRNVLLRHLYSFVLGECYAVWLKETSLTGFMCMECTEMYDT